jgi:hypothetical protein
MKIDLAALEAEALEAEVIADAIRLTEDEERAASLFDRLAAAKASAAAKAKAKRDIDLATREQDAAARLGRKVLVKGIDLVSYFPPGKVPPPEHLPGGGVIVVRNPAPRALGEFHAEVEHKKRSLAAIYADLLCPHVVDPPPESTEEHARLRAFCEAYEGAAIAAGDEVAKLGGSRARADKRGGA